MLTSSIFFSVLLGLVMGSFMSVIVFRLGQKEGIVTGRSECSKCLTRLRWYDLVPLLSYLFLIGKCRYCRTKVSMIYPLMEIATAVSFGSYCFTAGPCVSVSNFYSLAIIFIFLSLAFFDYVHYILPDKLIASGIILTIVYDIFFLKFFMLSNLYTGLVMGLFFATIYLVSKGEWMGFGDVKLVFLIGLVLGYPMGFWSVIVSIWVGAIVGILMMLIGKANLKTQLPFGTFMAGSAVLFIIFYNSIQTWISKIIISSGV